SSPRIETTFRPETSMRSPHIASQRGHVRKCTPFWVMVDQGRGSSAFTEGEAAFVHADDDGVARGVASREERFGHGILELAHDDALQRPRAEGRLVAELREAILRGV